MSLTPAARWYLLHVVLLTGALGIGALFHNLTIDALGYERIFSRPTRNARAACGVAAATLVACCIGSACARRSFAAAGNFDRGGAADPVSEYFFKVCDWHISTKFSF